MVLFNITIYKKRLIFLNNTVFLLHFLCYNRHNKKRIGFLSNPFCWVFLSRFATSNFCHFITHEPCYADYRIGLFCPASCPSACHFAGGVAHAWHFQKPNPMATPCPKPCGGRSIGDDCVVFVFDGGLYLQRF